MPAEVQNVLPEEEQGVHIVKAKDPVIFDQVEYVYTSYAQLIATSVDFRIALGDRIPLEGKVIPRVGIIMSHSHARSFFEAMAKQMAALDKALEKPKASPDEAESSGA